MWEWNEKLLFGSYRMNRGGSFEFNYLALRSSDYTNSDPSSGNHAIGFRWQVMSFPNHRQLLSLLPH